jgi:hypothetical protein
MSNGLILGSDLYARTFRYVNREKSDILSRARARAWLLRLTAEIVKISQL